MITDLEKQAYLQDRGYTLWPHKTSKGHRTFLYMATKKSVVVKEKATLDSIIEHERISNVSTGN